MEKSWAGIGVKTAHRPGDQRVGNFLAKNGLKSKESPKTGWWFQRFFISTPIWGRLPF